MKKKIYALLLLLFVLVTGGYYYMYYPAINIHKPSFWTGMVVVCLVLGAIFGINSIRYKFDRNKKIKNFGYLPFASKIFSVLAIVLFLVAFIGNIIGSPLLRAKKYASLLVVENKDFATDLEETEHITDLALMDTESARIFGNRKIGSLSEVVSQYEVERDYTQISIQQSPYKVSALKYASFFKWWNNRDKGIPGYVKVNPVNSNAEYVELAQGMKYVPSAYFNYNLMRHVQLKYPTKIISGYNFEIDDEGNPYYICPTVSARIGLFGGMDVNGIIICNPVDGSCSYYNIDSIPSWVDNAYDGHLLCDKYNWFGTLSGGFINSVFGQKDCKQVTDDFGYKIIGDDVWIYTGVTSVNGDQSNIGFVMMNQRTSEAKYYKVSGAEEHSAMAAAEGEVQEKGYDAAFPSLINVGGVPTYIMVLKDDGGLVKMYAMVNVEQYNIVATASTQNEVFANYKKLLKTKGGNIQADISTESRTEVINVADIQFINTEDGNMVYIKDEKHNVYKQKFEDNEQLVRITAGDTIKISYEPSEDGINYLSSYEFVPAGNSGTDTPLAE
ncbi:MAG: hypothetical protein OSJ45_14485 [Lachnospiraceae bacterium]|nr:hypothetical protein [Lachnospiraceae bacterium]